MPNEDQGPPPEDPRTKLVGNERAKLTATWVNGISVATVAVGGIAPLVATLTGAVGIVPAAISSVIWCCTGIGLHFAARAVLRRLRP